MTLETLIQAWRLGYADGREQTLGEYQHCRCRPPDTTTNVVRLDDFRPRRNGTN